MPPPDSVDRVSSPLSQPLRFRLLGPCEFTLGAPLRFAYAKVKALLVLLMLDPTVSHRDGLTAMLWPDVSDPGAARRNLRHALHALRAQVGSHRLVTQGEHVRWCAEPGDATDVDQLMHADPRQVGQLLAAYHGEAMAGLSIGDAPEFMDWLQARRLACHAQVLACVEQAIETARGKDQMSQALVLAELQVRIDPWNERSQLRLMRLLVDAGQTNAALARWELACDLFQRELDLRPGEALQTLLRDMLGDRTAASAWPVSTADKADKADKAAADAFSVFCEGAPAALLLVDCRANRSSDRQAWLMMQRLVSVAATHVSAAGGQWERMPTGGVLARFGAPTGRVTVCEQALDVAAAVLAVWKQHDAGQQIRLTLAVHRGVVLPFSLGGLDPLGSLSGELLRLAMHAESGDVVASDAVVQRCCRHVWLPLAGRSSRRFSVPADDGVPVFLWGGAATSAAGSVSPLVGRGNATAALRRDWSQVLQGAAQVRLVSGPPGTGKSRLMSWLLSTVIGTHASWWVDCLPSRGEAPGEPLTRFMSRLIGLHAVQPHSDRLQRLHDWVDGAVPDLPFNARQALAVLLGLEPDDPGMSPPRRRKELFQALTTVLRQMLSRGPLVLIFEDVHWADAVTRDFIQTLPGDLARLPLWVLLTTRPSVHSWPAWARVELPPLSRTQSLKLARHVARAMPREADRPHDGDLLSILDRANGNPLFIEALVRSVGATGRRVPLSLEEGLLATLAGDAEVRHLAGVASVLGEEFEVDLLLGVAGVTPVDHALQTLTRLCAHGLVQISGDLGRFQHALIRDACYQSLNPELVADLHRTVVEVAVQRDASLAERLPLWLARHALAGGLIDQAAEWFEQAALQSLAVASYSDAAALFSEALSVIQRHDGLRAWSEHAQRLALGRAHALVPLHGYGASVTRDAYRVVLDMSKGELSDAVFQAQYGLWLGASSHGGYRLALNQVALLQAHADSTRMPIHQLQTAYAWGNTYLWLGELAEAREHLERALALSEDVPSLEVLSSYIEDTGVVARALLSWSAWLQGDSSLAYRMRDAAIERARQLAHPYSLAFALACAGRLAVMRRDPEGLEQWVTELDDLADRHELALWRSLAAVERGWLLCDRGEPAGAVMVAQGVDVGALALPALEVTLLSMQADALHRLGSLAACSVVIEKALDRCQHWNDHYMQPDLLRLAAQCEPDERSAGALRARARAQAVAQGAQAWLRGLA